jgi:hypothetical protein
MHPLFQIPMLFLFLFLYFQFRWTPWSLICPIMTPSMRILYWTPAQIIVSLTRRMLINMTFHFILSVLIVSDIWMVLPLRLLKALNCNYNF